LGRRAQLSPCVEAGGGGPTQPKVAASLCPVLAARACCAAVVLPGIGGVRVWSVVRGERRGERGCSCLFVYSSGSRSGKDCNYL
jgi:hypothetical protein